MASIYLGYSNHEANDDRLLTKVHPAIMKARFLEVFMHTAHIAMACNVLGLVPRTIHNWRYNDKQFAADFEMAKKVALGVLEDEATRRAIYGIDKPVFYKGIQVGSYKEYSDQLLILLLKANAPEKYKDKFADNLTDSDGKPFKHELKVFHVHSEIPIAESEEDIVHAQLKEAPTGVLQFKDGQLTPIEVKGKTEDVKHEVVVPARQDLDDLLG